MKKKNIPCADCCMRRKYEANPRSLVSRFWHWHTRFCPGWKAFMKSLSEEEREEMRIKYDLRHNRKNSSKRSEFLRFYLYFCYVIQSFICFYMQH